MTEYGKHDFEWNGECPRCGVHREAIEDNLASDWCDQYEMPVRSRVAMWAHLATIFVLVGMPLIALVVPHMGAGQFLFGCMVFAGAILVAEIHAGMFDEVLDSLRGRR